MMRARLTYIPLEVADHFEDFIIKRDEQVLDAVRAKTRDFSTLSILKLLYQVRGEPMTFSSLYSKSKIRMKRSFLNYLHLCVYYKFIEKNAVWPNMIYSITDQGKTILYLFLRKTSNKDKEVWMQMREDHIDWISFYRYILGNEMKEPYIKEQRNWGFQIQQLKIIWEQS